MARVADDLYEALGPFTSGDNGQLLALCEAIADGTGMEQINGYVAENDREGWRIVFDPEDAPIEVLPYLAQFSGAVLEDEDDEAAKRSKIKSPASRLRGTVPAMIDAIQRTLTGSESVNIVERWTSAYTVWIRSRIDETPSTAATWAAILTQKPIGLVVTYEAVAGQSWSDLIADHASWTATKADYASWQEAIAEQP